MYQNTFQQVQHKNWLRYIPDNTLVTQLSIPGTHDSAAYHTTNIIHKIFTSFVWKTQDYNINQQLQMGIRFFDIRIRCQEGERLTLCHGPVNLGKFQRFIKHIVQFLKKQKTQFIILLFQKQQGKQNSANSGCKIIRQILQISNNEVQIFKYDHQNKTVPNLKQLRGKLWLMEAYPGNKNRVDLVGHMQIPTWCSNKTLTDGYSYIIQNYWQGPEQLKKQQIIKLFSCRQKTLLKINFIIQSNLPRFYALIYNGWLYDIINQTNIKNMGIVILDFPSKKLINMIIKNNF